MPNPRSTFLLLLTLLLTACTQNPATGGYSFTLANQQELTEGGDAVATATLRAEGVYRPDSPATPYVTGLCNRIYAVTEAAAEAVQCNLADDNTVNAFAAPGYLFLDRGLLAYLSSEAEVAAILGHEAGHLNARHAASGLTRRRLINAALTGGLAAVASTDPGYPAVETAAVGAQQASQIGLMSFSRSQETEADALGRRYMAKAGYDARESVNAERAMALYEAYQQAQARAFNLTNPSFLDKLKSSHPATPERLAAALAATGEPPILTPAEDLTRQRYMAAIEGLTYGPARRYGIPRVQELVLTRQRLIIPLPAGATTDYLSSNHPRNLGTWLIGMPQSGVAISLTSLPLTTGLNPGNVVRAKLPFLHTPVTRLDVGTNTPPEPTPPTTEKTDAEDDDTDASTVPTGTIVGYTATYHYLNSSKQFRTIAFNAATRQNEMIVLDITYPDETTMQREDAALIATLQNVRFLTRDQSLKYKQLYLHTFTALTGQTVAQQAAHLPVGALQEDLFRALNNLQGTELQPGQLYKTILDPNL